MSDRTPDRHRVVAAFVPDLMDRSRFGGATVTFVRSGEEAKASTPSLIIVDLDRCATPGEFLIEGVPSFAFASHVDDERLCAASALGFGEVLARSVFFRRLPTILASTATPAEGTP